MSFTLSQTYSYKTACRQFLRDLLKILLNLLLFWGFSQFHCASVLGQIAAPVPGVEGYFTGFKEYENMLWIGTDKGLFVFEKGAGKAREIKEDTSYTKARNFYTFDDKLFFQARENSFYYIEKGKIKPNLAGIIEGEIKQYQLFNNTLWLMTESQLYYIAPETSRTHQIDFGGDYFLFSGLTVYSNYLWIATNKGLLASSGEEGARPEPVINILNEPDISRGNIKDIMEFRDYLWITVLEDRKSNPASVAGNDEINNYNLNASENNVAKVLYRIGKDKNNNYDAYSYSRPSATNTVKQVMRFTGKLFISKDNEQYFIEGSNKTVGVLSLRDSPITSLPSLSEVIEFDNSYWGFCNGRDDRCEDSLWRWVRSNDYYHLVKVEGVDDKLTGLQSGEKELWIGTRDGLFRVAKGESRAEKYMNVTKVRQMMGDGTNFLFIANTPQKDDQLFFLNNNIQIEPVLTSSGSLWKDLIGMLPGLSGILINGETQVGLQFKKSENSSASEANIKNFRYLIKPGDCEKNFGRNEIEYSPAAKTESVSGLGRKKFCIGIRDEFGIFYPPVTQTYWIIPDFFGTLFSIPLIFGGLGILVLILAPHSQFCHNLIMNPTIRKIASFGLIPAFITIFPSVRRYIFKRYMRRIKKDFEASYKSFVHPSRKTHIENFGKELRDSRRILLSGQSGIGKTSYFRYLTACYARGDADLIPKNVFPVFIRLSNYKGDITPRDLVFAQLQSLGSLTDEELNDWFLKQGGFLIFFDGVNEIPDSALRAKLGQFVEQYWKNNYICLSSQEPYEEFSVLTEIKADSLNENKVKELLYKRLSEERAKEVIKELDKENSYKDYKIPIDLDLAIEIKERNKNSPLPKTRDELYKKTLRPFLFELRKTERDLAFLLCERAYEMLINRDRFINNGNSNLTKIINELKQTKFKHLAQDEENYRFRHDSIRAYLASRHFTRKWRALLNKDDVELDSNWLDMLKFSIPVIGRAGATYFLMEKILEKSPNTNFVGEFFNWIKKHHPKLIGDWENDFKLKFADIKLNEITNTKYKEISVKRSNRLIITE